MKQLRNFSAAKEDNNKNNGKNGANENKTDAEYINEAIGKYSGMNEDELVNTLLSSVQKSKQEGTYNPQQLLSFAEKVAPYIDAQQKDKLYSVISLLNSDNG